MGQKFERGWIIEVENRTLKVKTYSFGAISKEPPLVIAHLTQAKLLAASLVLSKLASFEVLRKDHSL